MDVSRGFNVRTSNKRLIWTYNFYIIIIITCIIAVYLCTSYTDADTHRYN